jgi:hypothetical protein
MWVSNRFVLGGKLRVALRNGFVPKTNDVFYLLGGMLEGNFSNAPADSRINTKDNLGSFRVEYGDLWLRVTDYQPADADGDNIEDAWAFQHFGHSPLTEAEKLGDKDGDGASNYAEFASETSPGDPGSAFKITSTARHEDGSVLLQFSSVEGRGYHVWFSDDLVLWNEAAEPTFAFPAAGVCEWTDDGSQTGSMPKTDRYYRISVD